MKYIQAAGGKAVYLDWRLDKNEMIYKLSLLNGIIFTGGSINLADDFNRDFSPFTNQASLIINEVFRMNLEGDFFPLYGIC